MSDKKQPEKSPKSAKPMEILTEEEKAEKFRETAADEARKIAEATLSRYRSWVTKIKGRHAFRGQANAQWSLTTSAYRRLKRNLDPNPNLEDGLFSGYLHHLIDDARERFSARLSGKSDLKIMADLQHYGAATGLLDFTEDAKVALWMACQSAKNEKGKEMDGRVFAVPLDGDTIREVSDEMVSGGKLKDVFSICSDCFGRLWFWRPDDGDIDRMFAQQSVFIFGRKEIDDVKSVSMLIPGDTKKKILSKLEELGTTEQTLFPDFSGFSAANGQDRNFPARGGKLYQDRADSIEKECRKTREVDDVVLSSDIHILRADFRRKEGDFRGALTEYDRALATNPEDALILNDRGNIKNMLGDFHSALEDFNRALEISPQYAVAYNNRSTSKVNLEDYQGALEDCNFAIKSDQKNAIFYNSRGNAKIFLMDYVGALEDFNHALALDPKYVLAYNSRGHTKNLLGDYHGAMVDFERAIALNPQDDMAYNNRGNSKYQLGDYFSALEDYKQAVALNPQDVLARSNIGNAKMAMGDHEGAIEAFNNALDLDKRAEVYFNRGLAQINVENRESAIADWKEAIRIGKQTGRKYVVQEAIANLAKHAKPK